MSGNYIMYLLIENKITKQCLEVEELSDFLFEEGWRFIRELSNSIVNIHVVDENQRQINIQQYGF
jgi:hypothetical protein